MSIRDARRSSRALALTAVLTFACVPAFAMPRDGASRPGAPGAFTAIFETLRSVWLSVWGDSGLTIDPDGRQGGSGMFNVHENEGVLIDPNGGRPAGSGGGNATPPGEGPNEGITIDPNG